MTLADETARTVLPPASSVDRHCWLAWLAEILFAAAAAVFVLVCWLGVGDSCWNTENLKSGGTQWKME